MDHAERGNVSRSCIMHNHEEGKVEMMTNTGEAGRPLKGSLRLSGVAVGLTRIKGESPVINLE